MNPRLTDGHSRDLRRLCGVPSDRLLSAKLVSTFTVFQTHYLENLVAPGIES
jgi:hypothetical protein